MDNAHESNCDMDDLLMCREEPGAEEEFPVSDSGFVAASRRPTVVIPAVNLRESFRAMSKFKRRERSDFLLRPWDWSYDSRAVVSDFLNFARVNSCDLGLSSGAVRRLQLVNSQFLGHLSTCFQWMVKVCNDGLVQRSSLQIAFATVFQLLRQASRATAIAKSLELLSMVCVASLSLAAKQVEASEGFLLSELCWYLLKYPELRITSLDCTSLFCAELEVVGALPKPLMHSYSAAEVFLASVRELQIEQRVPGWDLIAALEAVDHVALVPIVCCNSFELGLAASRLFVPQTLIPVDGDERLFTVLRFVFLVRQAVSRDAGKDIAKQVCLHKSIDRDLLRRASEMWRNLTIVRFNAAKRASWELEKAKLGRAGNPAFHFAFGADSEHGGERAAQFVFR